MEESCKRLKIDKKIVPKLQELWHSSYEPVKGMKELIANLRKNYTVIVFSGSIKERVEYLNNKYSLYNDFDDFVLSYDVGYSKRDVGFYKFLLKD